MSLINDILSIYIEAQVARLRDSPNHLSYATDFNQISKPLSKNAFKGIFFSAELKKTFSQQK